MLVYDQAVTAREIPRILAETTTNRLFLTRRDHPTICKKSLRTWTQSTVEAELVSMGYSRAIWINEDGTRGELELAGWSGGVADGGVRQVHHRQLQVVA
jgi:hypothetical protein